MYSMLIKFTYFMYIIILKNQLVLCAILKILFGVIGLVVANKLINEFYHQFKKIVNNKSLYEILIFAIEAPLKICIWVLVFLHIIASINKFFNFNSQNSLLVINKIISISLFSLFAFELMHEYNGCLQKIIANKVIIPVGSMFRILKIVITCLILLTSIETFGININGLLTFGSVGGLILGFASKDLLANLFGATLIYLDQPFVTGDWVRSPDKNIEGIIESISWRLTKIRTFDKRPLYVPNSIFTNIVIENSSRMSHRRIKEIIGIRYCDINVITKITDDIRIMLYKHKDIASDQTLAVNLYQFNNSSIDFMIYAFTKTINWVQYQDIKQNILLQVSAIIKVNKAEIAFPTRKILYTIS